MYPPTRTITAMTILATSTETRRCFLPPRTSTYFAPTTSQWHLSQNVCDRFQTALHLGQNVTVNGSVEGISANLLSPHTFEPITALPSFAIQSSQCPLF